MVVEDIFSRIRTKRFIETANKILRSRLEEKEFIFFDFPELVTDFFVER